MYGRIYTGCVQTPVRGLVSNKNRSYLDYLSTSWLGSWAAGGTLESMGSQQQPIRAPPSGTAAKSIRCFIRKSSALHDMCSLAGW